MVNNVFYKVYSGVDVLTYHLNFTGSHLNDFYIICLFNYTDHLSDSLNKNQKHNIINIRKDNLRYTGIGMNIFVDEIYKLTKQKILN